LKYSILHTRFSARILGIAFLAALAVGVAAAPHRIAAQQAAPAAQPATPAAAPEAAKPEATQAKEAPKTEQEGDNKYLHAPVVQTMANLLHLKLETAAWIFQFINFAIIVLAIGIPLVRTFPRIVRKRSETIRHNIESARKVTEDANLRLSAVEAKLASLDEEIAKFRTEVEQEIGQDEVRIKATLVEESARIVSAAEQEIVQAAAHAQRGLRHFAADLAIEQAAKQLVLTPETDRALIAEFISGANKGGQN
jgi:F-type H+-transporting ATPase subunit b